MMTPSITIGIPAYNAEAYVRATIISCLEQTVAPYEILLSDDGSSDQTPAILREYQDHPLVRLVSPPQRLGLGGHYRHLVNQAKGTHVVILSSDDALHPQLLKKAVSQLEKEPDLGMLVFSGYLCNARMQPQSRFGLSYPRELLSPPQGCEHFLQACTYLISFTVWPTALLQQCPPLPDEAGLATDWYWALWVSSQATVRFSSSALGYYRYHDQNASHSDCARWRQQAQAMLGFISQLPQLDDGTRESLLTAQSLFAQKKSFSHSPEGTNTIQTSLKNLIKYASANLFVNHPNFLK